MLRIGLLTLLVGAALPASAQSQPSFVGDWGGGPTTCDEPFRFTAKQYAPPGMKLMRMKSVERDGKNYLLSFPDGYRVSLFDVGRRSMTWHSPISGDTFELRRCE